MGQRVEDGQFDLVRAKEGGLDAMFFSLFVTEQYYPARFETKQTLRLIDAAYSQLEKNKDKIQLAYNATDVERIATSGKIAAFMVGIVYERGGGGWRLRRERRRFTPKNLRSFVVNLLRYLRNLRDTNAI